MEPERSIQHADASLSSLGLASTAPSQPPKKSNKRGRPAHLPEIDLAKLNKRERSLKLGRARTRRWYYERRDKQQEAALLGLQRLHLNNRQVITPLPESSLNQVGDDTEDNPYIPEPEDEEWVDVPRLDDRRRVTAPTELPREVEHNAVRGDLETLAREHGSGYNIIPAPRDTLAFRPILETTQEVPDQYFEVRIHI